MIANIHTVIEVSTMVVMVGGGVLGATWRLGSKLGIIETKIDSVGNDVNRIRTNDLYHIERRFENIERVLMEGKGAGKD